MTSRPFWPSTIESLVCVATTPSRPGTTFEAVVGAAMLGDPRVRLLLELGGHGLADLAQVFYHRHAALAQRGDLARVRAGAALDDGARVAHAASGRGALAGDEAEHGLAHAVAREARGFF